MHRDEGFLNEFLEIARRGAGPLREKFPYERREGLKRGAVRFRVPLESSDHETRQPPLFFVGMARQRRRRSRTG